LKKQFEYEEHEERNDCYQYGTAANQDNLIGVQMGYVFGLSVRVVRYDVSRSKILVAQIAVIAA
jgi:hypothetical protein